MSRDTVLHFALPSQQVHCNSARIYLYIMLAFECLWEIAHYKYLHLFQYIALSDESTLHPLVRLSVLVSMIICLMTENGYFLRKR